MKQFYASLVCGSIAVVALAFAGWALLAPASAAPPTVTPSPGYDARLQEQRAAQSYNAPVVEPAVPTVKPVHRRHVKPTRDGAH